MQPSTCQISKLKTGDYLLLNSAIEGDRDEIRKTLEVEYKRCPRFSILTSVYLDKERRIFFHGGYITPRLKYPMPIAAQELPVGQFPELREVDRKSVV